MTNKITRKHNIINPDKWVGKYVRHMANWWDYAWANDNKYAVCQYTGKLITVNDIYEPLTDAEHEQLKAAGWEDISYYSQEAAMKMLAATTANLQ